MAQTSLLRPEGLVQSPAFTHVAVVPPGATTVYIGGQNAIDGDGTLVGGADVVAQTQQVMKNLHVALAAAGASVQDLVMMTVLFVDGVDLTAAYPVAAARWRERRRRSLACGWLGWPCMVRWSRSARSRRFLRDRLVAARD